MDKNNMIEYLSYHYDKYSSADKNICHFFISNRDLHNLDIKTVSKKCNVSNSTITRFAKKNGFTGYKEFLVYYQKCLKEIVDPIQLSPENIMKTMHQKFLEKLYNNFEMINFNQIIKLFKNAHNLFIFGYGKTSLVAQMYEMKLESFDFNIFSSPFAEHFEHCLVKHAKNNDLAIILYHHDVYNNELQTIIRTAKNIKTNIIILSLDSVIDELNYANSYQLFPDWQNNVSKNTTTMYLPYLAFIDIVSYSFI